MVRTVGTGNGAVYDSDADSLWTRRRLKHALEAEAFWAGGMMYRCDVHDDGDNRDSQYGGDREVFWDRSVTGDGG